MREAERVRVLGSEGKLRESAALLLVLLAALAFTCTKLADGDLGFHLATGREVLASGRIPSTNVLSYTCPEQPWLLHQWLPGVLFEWLQHHGGLFALQSLRLALVGATWLVVYAAARIAGALPELAALTTVVAEAASAFRFQLRPYLFTHLSLAITVACAAAFLRALGLQDLRAARRALAAAALTAAVASHFHAGVIDSWLVLFALLAACFVEPLWRRTLARGQAAPLGPSRAGWVALALGGSIALSALSLAAYHPYGARVLLFPFDMGTDAYLADHLVEFRPPFRFAFALLAPYWGLLTLCLVLSVLGARRVHPFWQAVMWGFMLLSLKHARLAYGFAVAAAPFAAVGLGPLLTHVRPRLLGGLALFAAPLLLLEHYGFDPPGFGLSPHVFPSYLFDYLEKQRIAGPLYASDAWGGPLIGRFYPERRAFFDNRFEAYPREFYLDVYQHIRYGLPGWDGLLDRYHVQAVLMRYTTPGEAERQNGKPNVRQLLARDPRWSLVTFDDEGELFVRNDGPNAQHAAHFALPGLDPDAARFLTPARQHLAELTREIARGNRSARVRVFAAHAAIDAGELSLAARYAGEVADDEAAARFMPALRTRLLLRPRP